MKLALIGAGSRGMIYAQYAHHKKGVEIVAVVEPREDRRLSAAQDLEVEANRLYSNTDDFFAAAIDCDAVIIASMDRDHYEAAMKAINLGYNLLLEKPMSPDQKECIDIIETAKAHQVEVTVCHVLRYTNFFNDIKKVLDSGELGKIIAIQHNENVGNFHMAHSFVRGNWGNADKSSPIILQKSCHDMDILKWMVGSPAKRISSFGDLTYFKAENAPANSSTYCYNCPAREDCHYDAYKAYLPIRGEWPATMVSLDQTAEGLSQALKTSPYGRCVYKCDNNVCDHQVTIIEFENGVTASFVLSGFTNSISRSLKIMCEKGEIRASDLDGTIEITHFTSNAADQVTKRLISSAKVSGGHGGGDALLMEDFLARLTTAGQEARSSAAESLESHLMAFAAEESRTTGQTIDMAKYRQHI
ncbi:MAG: Gfo/Idh/MocA family oxidoreductase [Pseudobutyrivibrio sp.]|nr:Gfo/Idh/MocA family oxidoreductase [Pseudobutyrivibrio sp.]